jgi:hypothetical protein
LRVRVSPPELRIGPQACDGYLGRASSGFARRGGDSGLPGTRDVARVAVVPGRPVAAVVIGETAVIGNDVMLYRA